MNTAEILSLISWIALVIAAVSLILAVFFWFRFKIPSVIGDLSGRTARKSIAKMREDNERTGKKSLTPVAAPKSPAVAAKRQPSAVPVQPAAVPNAPAVPNRAPDERPETGLLQANKAETYESAQTDVLDQTKEDALEGKNVTMRLVDPTQRTVQRTGGKKLVMLDEVIFIHTDEVI